SGVEGALWLWRGCWEAGLGGGKGGDVPHPADLPALRQIVADGRGGTVDVLEIEKRYLRKDGTVAWGHTTITWLRDSRGRPLYGIKLIQDIGERKRAEAALRESEVRKGAILDTALDAVITMDHEGRVTEFNPAAEKLFGYPREEAMGRSLSDLVMPPEMRAAHRRGLTRYLETGRSLLLGRLLQMTAMRRDGTEFP